MELFLDIASWALLSVGGVFVFIGGIGVLRMPDLYTRIHAASLTDTMGAIMIIVGIMLQAGLSLAAVKLAATLLFLLLTSPTASNALASAALLAGQRANDAAKPNEEQPK
ncbi:monovalent cation/H(+) antiporter subunit G [Arenicella xantha]|uniref:Multisubunit sodium/proton antiporter MrpG subunit n=1 Tax=Arenicella xantha TaxID=644221 RepID=A0A395JKF4_9GAMM|nr:monovalent cation/H(+) antiporter subunit G [Arenicella xantha]RBP51232.1 multisubunit sodium/proton antiporter MrpG subunit [Arenicella xantha]